MKKIFSIAIFLVSWQASAQRIEVKETLQDFGDVSGSAFRVFITGENDKSIEKKWENLLEEYDFRVKTSKGVMRAMNGTIRTISSDTIDVYTVIKEEKEGVELIAGFMVGEVFVSESVLGNEAESAKKIMYDFAVQRRKAVIEAELKIATSLLSDEKDKLEDLKKRNEKLKDEIRQYKERIADNERALKQNEDDQAKQAKKVEEQTKEVERIGERVKQVE
jgi:hypothetical protein